MSLALDPAHEDALAKNQHLRQGCSYIKETTKSRKNAAFEIYMYDPIKREAVFAPDVCYARSILPAFMHLVQTLARFTLPLTLIVTF